MKIGILAIQGDFELHKLALDKLSIDSFYVRKIDDLDIIDALVLPGGESTTISKLLKKYKIFNPIKEFAKNKSIFGTCAGAILMSRDSKDSRVNNLGCLDVVSSRNAWGSQIDSFSDYIDLIDDPLFSKEYCATFIRGPRFLNVNASCTVLGTYNGEPVLIRSKKHLISSFHPAFLMRQPEQKKLAWIDLKMIREKSKTLKI